MEALRLCTKGKLNVGVYAVSTVQEEVGLASARTAAYAVNPEVGIAIDVTHASDNPGSTSALAVHASSALALAFQRDRTLIQLSRRCLLLRQKRGRLRGRLPHRLLYLGNDANAIQVSRAGVAAASIGIPNRYMHTQVEVCSLKNLEFSETSC